MRLCAICHVEITQLSTKKRAGELAKGILVGGPLFGAVAAAQNFGNIPLGWHCNRCQLDFCNQHINKQGSIRKTLLCMQCGSKLDSFFKR
jgi:hypothetical protein